MISIDIIKKLFTKGLSIKERSTLNESKSINDLLCKQWEESFSENEDLDRAYRIWDKVQAKKHGEYSPFKSFFRNYSVAASVALFIACCSLSIIIFNRPTPASELWYTASIGRQNMDSIMFSDGSYAIVNAGTKITYPKEFAKDKRIIHLSGQAFFNIAPDVNRPFIVETKTINITALGTSFEVYSYDSDNTVETTLLTGKVKVVTNQAKNDEHILLPNQKMSYSKITHESTIEKVDANDYVAWRESKKLVFRNEKLSMIIPRLEKWYGQKIVCPEDIANHYRFTFSINHESLDLILSIMSKQTDLSFSKSDDGISYITK